MEGRNLFERLQSRRMFQWVIAYVAVAWGVAEATGFAIDNYGLPRTVLDVVLFLLLVSFLVLIVLVWSHGLRGRQRVTGPEAGLLAVLAVSGVAGSLWLAARRVDAASASNGDEVAVDLGDSAIAVLPFRSSVGDRELAWLARGIPELLSIQLARMEAFRIVSGQRVFDVLRQLDLAEGEGMPEGLERRVARLSGARLAVSGSVFGEPGALAIATTVSDVGTGEILASVETRGSDVFELVDEVSRSLRAQLGDETGTAATTASLLTTGSVDAYRAYEQGRQAAMRFQPQEAATHLRRAVSIDPAFALAHFRLALALFSLGDALEATEHLQRAREGLGVVSERDSLFIEGFGGFARDTTNAIATLRRLVHLYPDEKDGRILFAAQLAGARGADDPESRQLMEETLRLDPLYASGYNLLAYSYAATGDFIAADSLVRRYVELEPEEPNPLDSRGEILELAGRPDEAREAYLAALRVQPDFLYSLDHLTRLHLRAERPDLARRDLGPFLASPTTEVRVRARLLHGDTYLWEGALDAATDAYAEAERMALEAERPDLRAWALQDRIRVDLALGRYAEAEEAAREIRTAQPLSGWWITVLYDSLARAHDIEGMERWKPRVEAELGANPLTRANAGIVSDLLSVLIAHERGQHELALSLAADLPAHLRTGAVTGWPVFESMLAVGKTEELLQALRPITRPAPFTSPARLVPLVQRSATYYEGRAYEQAGDTARAVERYEALVAGMGDGLERLWFLSDAPERLRALTRD